MDEEEVVEEKKKSPLLMIILLVVGGIVLLGGAVGGTLFVSGAFDPKDKALEAQLAAATQGIAAPAGDHGAADNGHAPEGDGHGADPHAGGGGDAHKNDAPELVKKKSPDAQRFDYSYHEMKDLLANLQNSRKFMQVSMALMTRYDKRVFDNVKKHEFAMRSVALDVLRQTNEQDVSNPEFRKQLAEKIRSEMNATLEKLEDFGGIEELYFTAFVIQ